MKKETQHKSSSPKNETNAIEAPSISLPKGGGAIKSIDEKFNVNAVNGTAGISIPLPVSPARGCTPALSLSYNSGSGNGIFGLGWQVNLASIRRRTARQLPQYFDKDESDTFVLSDAEDLVPEFDRAGDGSFLQDANGDYVIKELSSPDNAYTIRSYRPRIENGFSRIERWYAKDQSEIKWRVISKDNITTLFGWSPHSRIADPADAARIYEWLPEFVFDDKGNCCRYLYKKENGTGLDLTLLHNKNRVQNNAITYTNCYIDKVLYCNKTPYKQFGDVFPGIDDFLFETAFDYGTMAAGDQPNIINDWDLRPDAFSDYMAGFEIRTTRLCKRVLLFHHFNGANEYNALVRSLNIEYGTATEHGFTFLRSATSVGYIKQPDNTYSLKKLPPLEFIYQKHDWNAGVHTVATDALVHAPAGIGTASWLFTDLYNEGLSGILTELATGWYYKHNLGIQQSATGDGQLVFENAKMVSPKPSFTGLGSSMHLTDLDADGGKQFTSFDKGTKGFFELNDDNEWQSFKSFSQFPNIDLNSPFVKMIDLNGDGKTELVISEDDAFTWYPSEGRNGYAAARKTGKALTEEDGPQMVFADKKQSIFLADMTGDGLTDIVRIRNGEVCYWPNLGYGRFGKKIAMDQGPVFDHSDAFNPSLIRLADIDGSGTTDIIYLRKNRFSCWMNLSGNRFAAVPYEIDPFPEIHSAASIMVTDLLGNGVACIVWASPLEKDAHTSVKYIDLMNGKKPHVMVKYRNNMGKEVSLEYTPSTKYYIADKLNGRPWITKLHFPVHCLSRTIVTDKVTGHQFTSLYTYHHGYYDHTEREFRGFGMVEQTDAETFEHWKRTGATNITEEALHQEPVISRQWFHTGACIRKEAILTRFEQDHWYNEMARRGFPVEHHEKQLEDARIIPGKGILQSYTDRLSDEEYRQAFRACKGMALRSELFAHDAIKHGNTPETVKKESLPYEVATYNCIIELQQPKGKNKYAVFMIRESEKITYSYERNNEDPRIGHTLNIKLDEYGNVLETASVAYPRKLTDATLPAAAQAAQHMMAIVYTVNNYTNDVIDKDVNRIRMLAETKTYELKGVMKANDYFAISDFNDILLDTRSDAASYHEINRSPIEGKALRRLIEHKKMLFYSNDLVQSLPLYRLESKGIGFETYELAYTPALLRDIFELKTNSALMLEGRFAHTRDEFSEDENWWIRSGTKQYVADRENTSHATNRFYMPVSYTEPFGAITKVKYYSTYYLMIEETEDALLNKSKVLAFNFRTLSPASMLDANLNRSEVLLDELGFVKAIAVLGKGNQADDLNGLQESTGAGESALIQSFFNPPVTTTGITDSVELMNTAGRLLQHATTRFVYDLDAYRQTGKPAVMASITRETHYRDINGHLNPESKLQLAFEYSAGDGKVIMIKVQAEPGMAKRVRVMPDNTITVDEIDTTPMLRWIGNGKTILNNKGNAVKQYEPYFSITSRFEDNRELVATGVTAVMYYDALNRLLRTDSPNGSFSKVEFDNWKQVHWDANDTVLESDWYLRRTDNTHPDFIDDVKEQQAAQKAALHNNTSSTIYLDSLGRQFLVAEHNKTQRSNEIMQEEWYYTLTKLDIEGNSLAITDARGNVVMSYKYDMLGNSCFQHSMDAGDRWMLSDVMGKPLRLWDSREQVFSYTYDGLRRPLQLFVDTGTGNIAFEQYEYGEMATDATVNNLKGKLFRHYDTAGVVTNAAFDCKGNLLASSRQLVKDYQNTPNWNAPPLLETETFSSETAYDALNRPVKMVAPDQSLFTPLYNEARLLNKVDVNIKGVNASTSFVSNINYNAKGQRTEIFYGNNTKTTYRYEPETWRLKRLLTTGGGNQLLQDLNYTYDPAGNITSQFDNAQKTVFYGGQQVEAKSDYYYDAVYRLIEASGREHTAQTSWNAQDNWNDDWCRFTLQPNSPVQMRNYTQKYFYDSVGNMAKMQHIAGAQGSFTREFSYNASNNSLVATTAGGENYTYSYNGHGSMLTMPHLQQLNWNFREQIQHVHLGGGGEAYYVYDSSGQRIRKVIERPFNKTEERIYLGLFEIYRERRANVILLERETLHVLDGQNRMAIIDTLTKVNYGDTVQLVRYQYSDHLGSACLELDADARIISYEEYHPYGTTAYQATDASRQVPNKRYRYTGMERDEESGLNYHSARYYAPWLGRWCNTDPIGIHGGLNVYAYCKGNPVMRTDTKGTADDPPKQLHLIEQFTIQTRATQSTYSQETNIRRYTTNMALMWQESPADYENGHHPDTPQWSSPPGATQKIGPQHEAANRLQSLQEAADRRAAVLAGRYARTDRKHTGAPIPNGPPVVLSPEVQSVINWTPRPAAAAAPAPPPGSSAPRYAPAQLNFPFAEGGDQLPMNFDKPAAQPATAPSTQGATAKPMEQLSLDFEAQPTTPAPRSSKANAVANGLTQMVPGVAEGVMATEAVGIAAAHIGAPRVMAAAFAGARAPGPAVMGGVVGAPAGVVAENVARQAGLGEKAATGVGLGTSVLTGAGVAVVGVLLVATAPVSLTVLGGAALVGGLSAGFGYLMSR